jgi:hypothetical protein
MSNGPLVLNPPMIKLPTAVLTSILEAQEVCTEVTRQVTDRCELKGQTSEWFEVAYEMPHLVYALTIEMLAGQVSGLLITSFSYDIETGCMSLYLRNPLIATKHKGAVAGAGVPVYLE